MNANARLRELGIVLPDYTVRPFAGAKYGRMVPFRLVGSILYLSGHVPEVDDQVILPGCVGDTLTTEQGYEAARIAGINALAGIRQAIGDLEQVKSLIRSLNFVVSASDYYQINEVSNGVTDLFADVFGPDRGIGCRATIGVRALTRNACFETWIELEVQGDGNVGQQ